MWARCKLCQEPKPLAEFVWRDRTGNTGITRRCTTCRSRGYRRNPALPERARYLIRSHAVHRYIERVRPGLSYTGARDEMIIRMHAAPFLRVDEAPAWCRRQTYEGPVERQRHVGVLVIDDDVVFTVSRYRTSTAGVVREKVATVLVRELARRL